MLFVGFALVALGFLLDPPWSGFLIILVGPAVVILAAIGCLVVAVVRRFSKKEVSISDEERPFRHFKMRPVWVVSLFFGLTLSWLAFELYEARQQRLAVAAIRSHGPEVYYYYDEKDCPEWIQATVGQDLFNYVRVVVTGEPKDLPLVKRFWRLETLELQGPAVTDSDLEVVAALKRLTVLDLRGSRVTDDGLSRLTPHKGLRILYLERTKVTKAGVERLQKALPECSIYTDWKKPTK